MHFENHEKIVEFNCDPEFHKNRIPGISAMMRVRNEEEFIKESILSVLDVFDEIVVVLNQSTDKTEHRVKQIKSDKIKVFQYPFTLHHNGPGHNSIPENSIFDNSYYYNWCLCKTTRTHVCKWDGDNVAFEDFLSSMKEEILKSNLSYEKGTNLAGKYFNHFSAGLEYTSMEPHYFKVREDTYYRQGELTQYLHHKYHDNILRIEAPTFLHFKSVKKVQTATQIWPSNWKELPHFKKIFQRRKTGKEYQGPYPKILQSKIINMGIKAAATVEPLKSQKDVLIVMGQILFELKSAGMNGNALEIGVLRGKTTKFLSKMFNFLFPKTKVYTIDPFGEEFVSNSLSLKNPKEIQDIYSHFLSITKRLKNHQHFRLPSTEALPFVPNDLIISFIDGEHTYNGVMRDFECVYSKTQQGGIIIIDDYQNGRWPGVGQAYQEILKKFPVQVRFQNKKSAFLKKT